MPSSDHKKAFAEMMEKHKKLIYKVSSMYCPKVEDRQDLMQEMAIQLWKAFPSYDERYKQSTWLYRVILNTAISFYRKHQQRNQTTTSINESILSVTDEQPDEELEENLRQLQRFIQQFDEFNKALMILYLEGNSYRDIATVLGISETNVATKISRNKQRLKEKFKTVKSKAL